MKALVTAIGLLGSALLLRGLPARKSSFKLLSSDWKDWGKLLLGVAGIEQINKALDWKPPVWLNTVQTIAAINLLMLGFNKSALRQFAVLAPLVTGMVQGTHWVSGKLEGVLEEKLNIPPTAVRLGLSALMMVGGLKIYPRLYSGIAGTGMLGAEAKQKLSGHVAGAGAIICSRGCCSSLVCMSEIGEYIGALGNWARGQSQPEKASHA